MGLAMTLAKGGRVTAIAWMASGLWNHGDGVLQGGMLWCTLGRGVNWQSQAVLATHISYAAHVVFDCFAQQPPVVLWCAG